MRFLDTPYPGSEDGVVAGIRQHREPQRHLEELREPAVRVVFEVEEQTSEKHGVATRVAREFGVGAES